MLCHSRSSVKDLRLHCCVLKKEDAENQLNARHAVKMLCFGKGCHQPVSAITVHLTARLKSCFVAEHFQQEGNEWKDYFSALMWMVIFRQAGQDGVAYRDGSTKPRNTQAPKFLHLAKLLYIKKKRYVLTLTPENYEATSVRLVSEPSHQKGLSIFYI